MRQAAAYLAAGVMIALASAARADELIVLIPAEGDRPASMMMNDHLMARWREAHARWREEYEARATTETIADYQKRLRGQFEEAIGAWPQRTPLNAKVTGVVRREGHRVEKVIYESMPGVYVAGALFLPEGDAFRAPNPGVPGVPGVLFVCGHSRDGKAWSPYQRAAALLALNGVAALMIDPIDQGERLQLLDEEGKAPIWGTTAHQMLGVQSMLLGRNTAWFEVWDGMRGIDYLQSRPEVDPERIGVMGNSGGGTQSVQIMTLDDRVKAAAVSCYITSFDRLLNTIGPQDAEQNIFGQLTFGMDHADYLMMRGPMPTLICAATKDFFDIGGTWDSFRDAKRLYTRLGFPERIDLMEADAGHNYDAPAREASARWMVRWLRGEDRVIVEPEIVELSAEEITASPRGQVMMMEGARSVYEVNQAYEAELKAKRAAYWSSIETDEQKEEARRRVREIVGIRPLADIPPAEVTKVGEVVREGFTIEKLAIRPGEGIVLPALLYLPRRQAEAEHVPVFLHALDEGKTGDAHHTRDIEQRAIEQGVASLIVDLRGLGETRRTGAVLYDGAFGSDGKEVALAYLLGLNYVSMRAEDLLVCARYLRERFPQRLLVLSSSGHMTGVAAMHAAALEPDLFFSVSAWQSLRSWSDVVATPITRNQFVTAVHGALEFYDLPDLQGLWGRNTINSRPVGADLRPIE